MPNKPTPVEVTVDANTTALLVLDLNARCENPEERCHKLVEPVAKFLPRARQARLFIVYTVVDRYKGTAEERMPHAFKQQQDESVLFPPAFDKFYSGELQPMLQQRGIQRAPWSWRTGWPRSCQTSPWRLTWKRGWQSFEPLPQLHLPLNVREVFAR